MSKIWFSVWNGNVTLKRLGGHIWPLVPQTSVHSAITFTSFWGVNTEVLAVNDSVTRYKVNTHFQVSKETRWRWSWDSFICNTSMAEGFYSLCAYMWVYRIRIDFESLLFSTVLNESVWNFVITRGLLISLMVTKLFEINRREVIVTEVNTIVHYGVSRNPCTVGKGYAIIIFQFKFWHGLWIDFLKLMP